MAVPTFNYPVDIKAYGRRLTQFDEASKRIVELLRRLGYEDEAITALVGQSPYNAVIDNSFRGNTVYGPAAYQAAVRKPHTGLFGAFFLLHLPEMQLAKQMPALLGKNHGFHYAVEQEGVTYLAPCQEMKFDFVGRSEGRRPHIVLTQPLALRAADGRLLVLQPPAELCPAVDNHSKDTPYHAGWIVDRSGKKLSLPLMAKILWGSLGARAMKALEQNRRDILQTYGTDDDVTAEQFMVEALGELKASHATDLIGYFNDYVAQAIQNLNSKPEYLVFIAIASQLSGAEIMARQDAPALGQIKHASTKIRLVANYLGVQLPKLDALQEPSHPQHATWKNFSQHIHNIHHPLRREYQFKFCEMEISNFAHWFDSPALNPFRGISNPFNEARVAENITLVKALQHLVEERFSGVKIEKGCAYHVMQLAKKITRNTPVDFVASAQISPEGQQLLDYMAQRLGRQRQQIDFRASRSLRREARRILAQAEEVPASIESPQTFVRPRSMSREGLLNQASTRVLDYANSQARA